MVGGSRGGMDGGGGCSAPTRPHNGGGCSVQGGGSSAPTRPPDGGCSVPGLQRIPAHRAVAVHHPTHAWARRLLRMAGATADLVNCESSISKCLRVCVMVPGLRCSGRQNMRSHLGRQRSHLGRRWSHLGVCTAGRVPRCPREPLPRRVRP